MKRLALGAAAAAIVFTLASCSAVDPEAMHVGNLTISQRDLEGEVAAFSSNPEARKLLETSNDPSTPSLLRPGTDGTVSTKGLAVSLLNFDLRYVAQRQLLAQAGRPASTPHSEDEVGAAIFGTGAIAPVWQAFPASARKRWAAGAADADALRAAVSGPTADPGVQQAFFEAAKDALGTATFDQFQAAAQAAFDDQTWSQLLAPAVASTADKLHVRVDPKYAAWDPRQGLVLVAVPLAGQPAAAPTGS